MLMTRRSILNNEFISPPRPSAPSVFTTLTPVEAAYRLISAADLHPASIIRTSGRSTESQNNDSNEMNRKVIASLTSALQSIPSISAAHLSPLSYYEVAVQQTGIRMNYELPAIEDLDQQRASSASRAASSWKTGDISSQLIASSSSHTSRTWSRSAVQLLHSTYGKVSYHIIDDSSKKLITDFNASMLPHRAHDEFVE